MKTLYSNLGVDQNATAQQIEEAYRSLVAKTEADSITQTERNNRLVVLSESYAVLANPNSRASYDAKLAHTASPVAYSDYPPAEQPLLSPSRILLIGVLVLAGVYLYGEKAKETERLRIEHEHEVQVRRLELDEARQEENAQRRLAADQRAADAAAARQQYQDLQQFERHSAQLHQQEMQRQRTEEQLRQQEQRNEAQRQQQEQFRAQQRLQADKRYLQQLEREHYGTVITH